MTYLVEYSRPAEKFIKKSKKIKRLFEEFKLINNQLEIRWQDLKTEQLSGELKFLYCHKFRINGVDYRIVFSVKNEEKKIFVWLAGTRENFYKELLRKLG